MGSWGLLRDIMEDQLWTDPASRFPAPPCLLPGSRSFLRNRSEPGGTDGAQGSLRAQIKQGLEESSQSVRVVFEGIYEGCVCVLKGECAFAGVCVYGGSVCEEGCQGGRCDSPTQQKGQSSSTRFTISWLGDLS